MTNQDCYKTNNIAEASALLTIGNKLKDIERINNICWFVFSNKDECLLKSKEFFFGDLNVSARSYHESYNLLKGRVFNI